MPVEQEAGRAPEIGFPGPLSSRVARAGGAIIVPGDPAFDAGRLIYNRLHNPMPLALVRTLDAGLLFEVASRCEALHLPLAIRGGGHHIGGGSGGDGGVVLDFSTFRNVEYCAASQICTVQPGARLADVDRELARHGRVIPTGTVSDTGIAGLAFGGGIGWLTGPLGLTCDHLVGADLLLADGSVVRAEDADHADLLWALRGGGGVGVALALRFRTAKLGPTTAGSVLVVREIEATLARLLDFLGTRCPRELTVAPVLNRADDGGASLRVEFCCMGDRSRAVGDLLNLLHNGVHEPFGGSFAQWQSHIDPQFLPPRRGYWKSCYLRGLEEAKVSSLVKAAARAPSAGCSILIEHLHGAYGDGDHDLSAFPLRNARFGVLFASRWPDVETDDENIGWVRDGYSRIDPEGTLPVYSNYASARDPRAASTFSASTQERLLNLRSRNDFAGLAPRPGAALLPRRMGASQ